MPLRHARRRVLIAAVGLVLSSASFAFADEPPDNKNEAADASAPAPAAANPDAAADVVAAESKSPERAVSIEPKPLVEPPTSPRSPAASGATFKADPVGDGALLLVTAGFAGLLDLIIGTGEVRPQQISPTFDRSQLLAIDRVAVSQNPTGTAGNLSNYGLFAAIAFAAVDPVLSGVRESSVQTGLVDAIIYAESGALAWAVTNLTKMAVRRPRPLAYIEAEKHKADPNYSNADTDSSLSFISGHAALTAALSATATYLAFARSKSGPLRPWITLVVGTALTTFVSIERVSAAKHFPTDVIAGALAGAGIGVLVPHLHRSEDLNQRRIWVGFAPASNGGGGLLEAGGAF